MKRCTFLLTGLVFACMNLQLGAQTTTTAPTTSFRSTPGGSAAIGAGAGIGTSAGNGSFSGGTGMAGGAGASGGASFSGGQAFAGGQGGPGGMGFATRGATTTTGPSTSNPFRASYVNIFAKGAASTKTFGQPTYATVTTTTAGGFTGGQGRGGLTGLGGAGSESTGFSTVGIRRAPAYFTTLAPDLPVIFAAPPVLLGELRATLEITDAIRSKNGIQIVMEGNTVVLRGRVENDRERRLAEGMVRLTPGVREVRNELVVP